MKFKLIIDKNAEECITAVCHERTPIIDQIESIIQKESNDNSIVGYADDEFKTIEFESIEVIYVEGGLTLLCLPQLRAHHVPRHSYWLRRSAWPSALGGSVSRYGQVAFAGSHSILVSLPFAADGSRPCGTRHRWYYHPADTLAGMLSRVIAVLPQPACKTHAAGH